MKLKDVVLIVLSFYLLNCYAAGEHLTFDNYNISDGLSQSTVYSIFEDQRGIMWFGTYEGGLNSFDGYDFTWYQKVINDSSSLGGNNIPTIDFFGRDKILLATNGTISTLNLRTDKVSNFFYNPNNNPLLERSLHTVPYDSGNLVLVGHASGVDLIDLKTGSIEVILRGISVLDLCLENKQELWIGTTKGLYSYTINTKSLHNYGTKNKQAIEPVNLVFVDSQNQIWFSSPGKGLFKIQDKEQGKIKKYGFNPNNKNSISNNFIRSIIEDKPGYLWIGTGNGLNLFNVEHEIFTRFYKDENNSNSLSQNSIYSLYKDSRNRLWVGTWNGGVDVINFKHRALKHFKHIPHDKTSLSNNLVSCFAESDNQLWIGTEKGGLNLYDPVNNSFKRVFDRNSLDLNHIIFLKKDERDNLWIGTNFTGLNYFNTKTFNLSHYMEDYLVSSIAKVKKNEYLACTNKGLYLLNIRNTEELQKVANLEEAPYYYSRLSKVKRRKSGQVILITSEGVYNYRYKTKSFKKYAKWDMPYNYRIDVVFEDSEENLWIGNNNGLFLLNDQQKLIRSCEIDSKSTLHIRAIIEGNNQNLWLSTNNGIFKYSKSQNKLVNFSNVLGLKHQEFIKRASYKSKDNNLYFGTINGFVVFNPEKIEYDSTYYPIMFTEIFILNKKAYVKSHNSSQTQHISQSSEINLTHKQNTFSIKYAALNYSKTKNTEYAYLLENYDQNWNFAGTQRIAKYSHLPSGQYKLLVKCTNQAGGWSKEVASINIFIQPPFWKTIWFRLVLIISIILLMLFAFRMRISVIKYRNAVLQKEVKIHTKEILQQKEEIEIMSEKIKEATQAKLRFYTNISHELRTPLTLIIGAVEKLLEQSRKSFHYSDIDSLNVIGKNSVRLMHLINRLMDFRKIEQNKMKLNFEEFNIVAFTKNIKTSFNNLALRKNIQFTFNSDWNELNVLLDRQKMEIVFFNLLSNAFKYTDPGGKIELSIQAKKTENNSNLNSLQISLSDTGCGIEQNQLPLIFDRFMQVNSFETQKNVGSGIGLALTKEIVQLHKGRINVRSVINEGSTFSIDIPCKPKIKNEIKKVAGKQSLNIEPAHLSIINTLETNFIENRLTQLKKTVKANVKKKRSSILVVDDNSDIRKLLYSGLVIDFDVFEAENGKDAIDMANRINPDLIISDYMMPEMNGFDFCSQIKSNITTSHIPVILLTAYTTEENHIKGLNFGADDYITKPFKMKMLKARVSNLLNSRKALRKTFSSDIQFNFDTNSYTKVDKEFLNKVIRIIEENIDDSELNVERVSSIIGYSSAHFLRKIQSLTNLKANEFIRNIRLKKAACLLSETELQVKEVMYMTGFESRSAFNLNFKKHLSITPTDYIKKFRKLKNV